MILPTGATGHIAPHTSLALHAACATRDPDA
jgi:hypothetical protein